MTDSNRPAGPGGQPGEGASWPEYLSGKEFQPGAQRPVSETGGRSVPHRVIGTPSPAESRPLLPEDGGGTPPKKRELPAGVPDERRAKRFEKLVAACFIVAGLSGLGFMVAYGTVGVGPITGVMHSNMLLGGTMALMFLLLGVGATLWVRHLMPQVELTEERHPMASTEQERAAFKETFTEGAEASGFVKRPIIRRSLIAASVPMAIAPIFLLRDLGPLPGTSLDHTVWRKGIRLVIYDSGRPITPAEFSTPGSLISVGPEGYLDNDDAMAKAAISLIKFRPGQMHFGPPARPGGPAARNLVIPNWTVDNIVAYSKICTHLGCPAALYEQTSHHILCPCHQSTFDATRGAQVIFGPASRPLPQLPIGVDSDGYLIATGPFNQPVGPTFWERS